MSEKIIRVRVTLVSRIFIEGDYLDSESVNDLIRYKGDPFTIFNLMDEENGGKLSFRGNEIAEIEIVEKK